MQVGDIEQVIGIETGQWTIIHVSRDNRLCHCSHSALENETHFDLKSPLYDPIRDKFLSLFENIVLRNLKSFFQLDHQVDISLYLIEAPPTLENKLV